MTPGAQAKNIDKILAALDDFFLQTSQMWKGSKDFSVVTKLELAVRQTIGVALKSQKAENYIEQLMELDEGAQEDLGAIVEACLGAIDECTSSRGSEQSIGEEIKSCSDNPTSSRTFESLDAVHIRSLGLTSSQEIKHKDLYKQVIIVENEAKALREKNVMLDREVLRLAAENELLRAEQLDMAGGS